jgi:hypothetical protein
MIENNMIIKNNDKLSFNYNIPKVYSGITFDTAPVDDRGNCDLWDLGDSLGSVIKPSDVNKVLQQLVYLVEESGKYHFSVTSEPKVYMIRAGVSDSYTRFFKKI